MERKYILTGEEYDKLCYDSIKFNWAQRYLFQKAIADNGSTLLEFHGHQGLLHECNVKYINISLNVRELYEQIGFCIDEDINIKLEIE